MEQTTPSSPSPSPAPSPEASPVAAQAAVSQPTPQSPAGTAQTRPEYVPESFWADGAVKSKEFGEHINQLATRVAAEDSRKLALPQAPDAYKIELPADFKPPVGVDAKIDEANPLWSQARSWAHKHGIPQEALSEAIGLVMGDRIGDEARIKSAKEAEVAKLGATGPARVDALSRFFTAYLGPQEGQAVMARVFTAADVAVMEKLVGKIGGSSSFSASGREPSAPGKISNEAFAQMSAAQRLDYARQHDQNQFARN